MKHISRFIQLQLFFLIVALIPAISFAEQSITLIAAGVDRANEKPFMTVSVNGGSNWTTKSLPYLGKYGRIMKISCTGIDSKLCVAVGAGSGPSIPLIAVSQDGGNIWEMPTEGIPAKGDLYDVSCTGSGASAICVAAGPDSYGLSAKPILVVSQDGGKHWQTKNIQGTVPPGTNAYHVSCTGEGSSSICVLAGNIGYQGASIRDPFLAVSQDGGTTWNMKSFKGQNHDMIFHTVSCTGKGASALCAAVGHESTGSSLEEPPLIVVSKDGATTWEIKSTSQEIKGAMYLDVSCRGEGNSAFCVASGAKQDGYFSDYLVAVSNNAGQNWELRSIKGFPKADDDRATEVSCTQKGICTVVGTLNQFEEGHIPFVAVSSDKGNTWNFKPSIQIDHDETLWNVYCADNASATTCIASGYAGGETYENPWFQISKNGGETWERNTSAMLPTSGNLRALMIH